MRRIDGIKAISFDADGTLWDFQRVMRHWLHYVLEELETLDARAAAVLNIEQMIAVRDRVARELKGNVTNLEQVRLEALRQTLEDVGRPNDALARHLNQVYLKHRFEDIELYSGVLPTLKALQAEYTLGILCNGNSYPERCGLQGMFQFVVFSQDWGVEKPDPRLFRVALEKAGCSEQELLHVGDSLENDIVGAANARVRLFGSIGGARRSMQRSRQITKSRLY